MNNYYFKVHFCSFNSVDATNLGNDAFHKHDKVFIPGYELSGKVLEVGKDVTADQVVVGENVAALNLDHFGGFAEECTVRRSTSVYNNFFGRCHFHFFISRLM